MPVYPSSTLRNHASALLSSSSPPQTAATVHRHQRTFAIPAQPFYKKKQQQQKKKPSSASAHVDLPVTTTEQVVIFTDGSARGNGKSHARAGYGIYFGEDEDSRNVAARVPEELVQTNQIAELLAATVALELCAAAEEKRKVIIITDSMYVINGITSWILGWKRNQWKTSQGKDVLHQLVWQRLDRAQQQMTNIQYIHVRGHQGVEGNEAADKLAVRGSMMDF